MSHGARVELVDLSVRDDEPVAAALIPRALTAGALVFADGARQSFEPGGGTWYVEHGRRTRGEWYVDDSGRFGSSWAPGSRTSYDLRWVVEGDEVVGLRFTELGHGARFEGRYST